MWAQRSTNIDCPLLSLSLHWLGSVNLLSITRQVSAGELEEVLEVPEVA